MGYDNEDERAAYAGEEPSRKSRRKLCLVVLLSVALIAIVLAVAIPVGITLHKQSQSNNSQPTGSAAINAACQATSYPASCNQTLSGSSPQGYSMMAVQKAQEGINDTRQSVIDGSLSNPNISAAVDVCLEVLTSSFELLDAVLVALESGNTTGIQDAFDDIMVQLSAAMEYHTTCLDTLNEVGCNNGTVFAVGDNTNEFLSNALALVKAFIKFGGDLTSWAKSAASDLSNFLPGNTRRLLGKGFTLLTRIIAPSFLLLMHLMKLLRETLQHVYK
jgi:pectinesterase inhibitor-like protein